MNPMEILLARLFSDPKEVERFLADRQSYAIECGLSGPAITEVHAIDAASLQFAAKSFERKRNSRD